MAAHRPEVIVSAGRPGLSRPQSALVGLARSGGVPVRHVVLAQGPGRWADPQRAATDVAAPDWRTWLTERFDRLDKWFEGRLAADVDPDDEVVTAEALLDGDRLKSILIDMAGRHQYSDQPSSANSLTWAWNM